MWRSSLLVALLVAVPPLGAGETQRIPIERLAWLAGCWTYDGRDPGSVEHWLPPAGGAMLAVSRVIKGGRMVSYEFLRVEETRDGTLRLIAAPVGQATTAFDLADIDTRSVAFENPDHDFPQRISYRLVGDDRLQARAEADNDGETVGIDFPMTRGDCD
ncbi:MAG: DUF6265 family protein [Pseudomonadota bacterium]